MFNLRLSAYSNRISMGREDLDLMDRSYYLDHPLGVIFLLETP